MDKQEWNGEGLPPVGSKCELAHACVIGTVEDLSSVVELSRGVQVRIAGHAYFGSGYVAVFECADPDSGMWCYGFHKPNGFRPIRSAEDKAVEAIQHHGIHLSSGVAQDIYRAIRDGKIPGVKLDK